nr:30S ribosomal protein S13 [Candidatus Woesearchaeota archaeon]
MAEQENIKQLIRLGDADIDGSKGTYYSLTKIRGISYTMANAICNVLNLEKGKKIGLLNDSDLSRIKEVLKDPGKFGIQAWAFNRRKDYDTGDNKHLVSSELRLRRDFDIKRMKEIKSYRGMRHAVGLPVRGQRTRSHFRKGTAIGVRKKEGSKKGRV